MRHRLAAAGIVAFGTAVFLMLADAASENDGPTTVDPHIAQLVEQDRSPVATTVARFLTFLGSEPVLAITTLLVLLTLLRFRRLPDAVTMTVAMAGSAALTVGAKVVVGRPRPGSALRLGPADHTYSFPSGHTLNSTVLLAMVALLVVPLLTRRRTRLIVWTVLGALAVGIGLSRVYLGYHWSTDVAGSWILASVWVVVVMLGRSLAPRDLHPSARATQQPGDSQAAGSTMRA